MASIIQCYDYSMLGTCIASFSIPCLALKRAVASQYTAINCTTSNSEPLFADLRILDLQIQVCKSTKSMRMSIIHIFICRSSCKYNWSLKSWTCAINCGYKFKQLFDTRHGLKKHARHQNDGLCLSWVDRCHVGHYLIPCLCLKSWWILYLYSIAQLRLNKVSITYFTDMSVVYRTPSY